MTHSGDASPNVNENTSKLFYTSRTPTFLRRFADASAPGLLNLSMTAIQSSSGHELSLNMADDSMEISSEFGQNVGDDDIDIDFEAGRNDEDYILEDAKWDIGLEGSYDINAISQQAIGYGDPMIDDERASYVMDDVYFIPEDNTYDQETDTDVHGIEASYLEGHNDAQDVGGTPTAALDYTQELEDKPKDADKQEHFTAETTIFEDKREQVQVPVVSPFSSSPQDKVLAREDGIHQTDSNVEYSKDIPSGAGSYRDADSTVVQGNDELETPSDYVEREQAAANNVVVVYRNAEYALISSSESDDPDSFFFKDDTLTKMPFTSFFNALREVLIDDLALEDELCLTFEELGLEIIESSTAARNVTFAQIINLRENLMRNDGAEKAGPVYVTLSTKTNFSKRLMTLTSGAAEGKGLSEFVSWDEVSESYGEADEPGKFAESVVGPLSNDLNHEGPPTLTDAADIESTHDVSTGNRSRKEVSGSPLGSTGDNRPEDDPNVEGAKDVSREGRVRAIAPLQGQGDVKLQNYKRTLEKTGTMAQLVDELDEDGDLIDYEDEEYEEAHAKPEPTVSTALDEKSAAQNGNPDSLPHCLKPSSCFCPNCVAHLLNEYEAINEDLRRRSISNATEEADAQSSNPAEFDVSPDYSVAHESTADTEDNVRGKPEYDAQNNDTAFGVEDQEAEQKAARDHQHAIESDKIEVANDGVTHHGENLNGIALIDDPNEELEDQSADEHIDLDGDFNGLDYDPGDHELGHTQDSRATNVQYRDTESDEGRAGGTSEEIGYEEAFEAPDSNTSEHTIAGDYPVQNSTASVTDEAHDEINYEEEDDDQLDLAPFTEAQVKTETFVPNGSTGKRARAETEDVVDNGGKGSKRARP